MKSVYVVGLPGAGKTTVVDLALKLLDLTPVVEHIVPVPHVRHGTLWHLGRHRFPFGGTDTLSMSISPKAIQWVTKLASHNDGLGGPDCCGICPAVPSVLLGEGDRLAHKAFFAACPALTVVWLDTPFVVAMDQAKLRARAQGVDPQDASWWKGRATKVRNLVISRPVTRLDGTRPAAESAADLAALLSS